MLHFTLQRGVRARSDCINIFQQLYGARNNLFKLAGENDLLFCSLKKNAAKGVTGKRVAMSMNACPFLPWWRIFKSFKGQGSDFDTAWHYRLPLSISAVAILTSALHPPRWLTSSYCPCTSCRTQNAHSRRERIHYMLKTEAKQRELGKIADKSAFEVFPGYMGWWELLFTPTQGKDSSSFWGLCRHIGCNYENVCSDTLKKCPPPNGSDITRS